jgi:Protein of unknown function (DUF3224)
MAIERVTGTLHGRSGSFVFVHSAVVNRHIPQTWSVVVVPDSGTEALAELSGTMKDGKHFCDFTYTLPAP